MTFEQFAATRLPGLLKYAVVLTGDKDLAQDVLQEVLARAQVRWRQIGRTSSPDAYVRRMLVNEYLSWRRSWAVRNVNAVGDYLVGLHDAQGGQPDHAQNMVDAYELWDRLATLGRKQRAVLVLRYYEQMDDEAIALVLKCSPATVRSNASKALKTLRLDAEQQTKTHVRETS